MALFLAAVPAVLLWLYLGKTRRQFQRYLEACQRENLVTAGHLRTMQAILEKLKDSHRAMSEGRQLDQSVIQSALAREAKAKAALETIMERFGVTPEQVREVMEKIDEG